MAEQIEQVAAPSSDSATAVLVLIERAACDPGADAPKLERLPEGMTIEVVGISTYPSGPTTWWGPDGTPLVKAPCDAADEAIEAPRKFARHGS